MGATTIPAANGSVSDNWTLISSVTPTAGVSTVSFTSIGNYKKLMFKTVNPGLSATSTLTLTLNSDTGSNYSYSSTGLTISTGAAAPSLNSASNTGLSFVSIPTNQFGSQIIFNDTNTSGLKTFTGYAMTGNTLWPSLQGAYFAASSITTVTLTVTTNTFAALGTVALYGVAA